MNFFFGLVLANRTFITVCLHSHVPVTFMPDYIPWDRITYLHNDGSLLFAWKVARKSSKHVITLPSSSASHLTTFRMIGLISLTL